MNRIDQVFPCYFPTTAIFIDDDGDFLNNFIIDLNERLPYRLFVSPLEALKVITERKPSAEEREKCFLESDDVCYESDNQEILRLNLNGLRNTMFDDKRFAQISVAVVDYEMKEMNGLDVCRSLEGKQIKRILLTGIADEQTAINAFNEGIIERYLLKKDGNVFEKFHQYIDVLQKDFFSTLFQSLDEGLVTDSVAFYHDPHVRELLLATCKRLDIVEYYLSRHPKGFFLIDLQGKPYFLLLQCADEMDCHTMVAEDQSAPTKMIEQLESKKWVPFFPTRENHYERKEFPNWESYLHPAKPLSGNEYYYHSLLTSEHLKSHGITDILSLDQFLDDRKAQFKK